MVWLELSLKSKIVWRFAWSNGENMEIDELLPLWERKWPVSSEDLGEFPSDGNKPKGAASIR